MRSWLLTLLAVAVYALATGCMLAPGTRQPVDVRVPGRAAAGNARSLTVAVRWPGSGRRLQFNGGDGALQNDVAKLVVGLFDNGSTTVPSLGYRYGSGGILGEAVTALSAGNSGFVTSPGEGVAAKLGTAGTGSASSGLAITSDRNNLRRYLVWDAGADTMIATDSARVSFTNVPAADGTAHQYLAFAAAYDGAGNNLGYTEAAVPVAATTGGDGAAPQLTLHLEQGVFTNELAASPSLVPYQPGAVSNRIWAVWTLAGSGATGSADGNGAAAHFAGPWGLAVGPDGTVWVADARNSRIRKVSADGVVTTIAGGTGGGYADGAGAAARFSGPNDVALDRSGNLFVTDDGNHRIRKMTAAGVVTTVAGSGTPGVADGRGTDAQFNRPSALAVDATGNVFVADFNNHCIRKVTPDGQVTTLAGSATNSGFANGTGSQARFSGPAGIAVDGAGTVYVGDWGNHSIRKVSADGAVTTLAGTGVAGFKDGRGTEAQFNEPVGLEVDGAGNVYVADLKNSRIRRITASGLVTTLAGSGTTGTTDGLGALAEFGFPSGVALDRAGNLYVADWANELIRKIGDPPAPGGKLAPDDIGDAAVHHDYVVTKNGVQSAFVWVPVFTAYQLINPAAAGHDGKPVGFWVKDKPSAGTEKVDWAKETFGGFYAGKFEASRADAQPGNPADGSGATEGSSNALKVARHCVPWTVIGWDTAVAACKAYDPHAHLMRDDEWTALAVWSTIEGVTVYGNNDAYYGDFPLRDYDDQLVTFLDDPTSAGFYRGLTGSGTRSGWSGALNLTAHTGNTSGVFDLNGNVWEWTEAVGADSLPGVYKVNGVSTGVSQAEGSISALSTDPRLRRLGLPGAVGAPSPLFGNDYYYRSMGIPVDAKATRGGGWQLGDSPYAGVWALALQWARSTVDAAIGFRAVLRY